MRLFDRLRDLWRRPTGPEGGSEAVLPAFDPARYTVIETILRKQGGVEDPEAIALARARYAACRRMSWHAVFAPGELGPESGAVMAMARPVSQYGERLAGSGQVRLEVAELGPDGLLRNVEFSGIRGAEGAAFRPGDEVVDDLGPDGGRKMLTQRFGGLLGSADRARARMSRRGLSLNGFGGGHARRAAELAADLAEECLADVAFPDRGRRLSAERALTHVVSGFEARRRTATLARFARLLDPEAMRLCRRAMLPESDLYNWLQQPEGAARTYRRQAVEHYPLFADAFARYPLCFQEIDAGRSPAACVAEHARWALDRNLDEDSDRVTEKVAAKLHGVTPQRLGGNRRVSAEELLGDFADTPPDWLPKSRKAFAAFTTVHAQTAAAAEALRRPKAEMIAQVGGRWEDWAEVFRGNPGSGLRDLADGFARSVIRPVAYRALASAGVDVAAEDDGTLRRMMSIDSLSFRDSLRGAFFGDAGLKRIMQASDRWHRELGRLRAETRDPEVVPDVSWAPLTPAFEASNGCRVVALVSDEDLRAEGAALSHCVGDYAPACLDDRHVLSIRDRTGRRLSTVELRETREERAKAEVVQHYTASNAEPDAPARKALTEYRKMLAGTEVDWAAIDAKRVTARAEMSRAGGIAAEVGYRPEDAARNERAFAAYRRYMPSAHRKAPNLTAFLEASGLGAEIARQARTAVRDRRTEARREAADRAEIERYRRRKDVHGASRTLFSEISHEEMARMSARQLRAADAFLVTPGEGLFRGYRRDPRLSNAGNAEALRGHLDGLLQGESRRFVAGRLADAADRTVVAPSVEEARVVRAASEAVAGREAPATRVAPAAGSGLGVRAPEGVRAAVAARYDLNAREPADLALDARLGVLRGAEALAAYLAGTGARRRMADVEIG